MKRTAAFFFSLIAGLVLVQWWGVQVLWGGDLAAIRQRGTLRHLGVTYANFVTGSGDGLDVEMVKLFAAHLGVSYQFVETSWKDVISDISGKRVEAKGDKLEILGNAPVKGDIAASGITILPWREKVVKFSPPTFPTQVWLLVGAQSPIQPITPTGDSTQDITSVKAQLKGSAILGMPDTCLDPNLYGLSEAGARVRDFHGTVNELVPAIISGEGEGALQDAPDALVAVQKWAGKVKIIGPVSPLQAMAYAFSPSSPELQEAFGRFFEQCLQDGTYTRLVRKYYPTIFNYYPDFFERR